MSRRTLTYQVAQPRQDLMNQQSAQARLATRREGGCIGQQAKHSQRGENDTVRFGTDPK